MKGSWKGSAVLLPGACAAALIAVAVVPPAVEGRVAIRGEVVHPVSGPAISDRVVLVGADGRIGAVGSAAQVLIPEGYRVPSGAVVTPGLVDARSVVGLAGHLNTPHDQDQMDLAKAIQPQLWALDAYNARELLVEWVRKHGTTTLQPGHAPGPLVSDQTMIVRTRGERVGEALVDSVTMVAMLGPQAIEIWGRPPQAVRAQSPSSARSWSGRRNTPWIGRKGAIKRPPVTWASRSWRLRCP